MRVTYSRRALEQLNEIFAFIAKDNPTAAASVVERIEALTLLLERFPNIGRPTDKEAVRVLSVGRYPYLVFYTVMAESNEVRILRVRHAAQKS